MENDILSGGGEGARVRWSPQQGRLQRATNTQSHRRKAVTESENRRERSTSTERWWNLCFINTS